jgi:hypothetical protein
MTADASHNNRYPAAVLKGIGDCLGTIYWDPRCDSIGFHATGGRDHYR